MIGALQSKTRTGNYQYLSEGSIVFIGLWTSAYLEGRVVKASTITEDVLMPPEDLIQEFPSHCKLADVGYFTTSSPSQFRIIGSHLDKYPDAIYDVRAFMSLSENALDLNNIASPIFEPGYRQNLYCFDSLKYKSVNLIEKFNFCMTG
ncbi:hypothetical protein FA95DRAFT_371051 [Auriscalpium vulgare]|uniref:Uncharacterized protein n=1 Tax=Auriscalpium vulgare TaxID=40419 RepID=A0ACB8RHN0_9AGAM|nr:hypothetical protein FA95DRAFT_371051 [Auriscalpium vulgare]